MARLAAWVSRGIEVDMRRLTKGFVIAGFLSAGALMLPGCAENDTMLYIQGVMALSPGDCTATADSNSTLLLGGVLDTYFRADYRAALLVGNQLVSRGSRDQLRTESNRVVLRGAEVTLLDSEENKIASFTVPGTGFVDVGTSSDPGLGVLSTILIPAGVAAADQLYLVDVRVFGDTLGGTEIESATLRFPVSTCSRCLLSFPLEADDPAVSGYQCSAGDSGNSQEIPCRLGQDEYVDCRLCAATDPSCQTP